MIRFVFNDWANTFKVEFTTDEGENFTVHQIKDLKVSNDKVLDSHPLFPFFQRREYNLYEFMKHAIVNNLQLVGYYDQKAGVERLLVPFDQSVSGSISLNSF